MSEIAVIPHAGMPIPALVVSVVGLAITVYFAVLKRVLPKDAQVSEHLPMERQLRPADALNLSANKWLIVIAFTVCPLVDVTVTNVLKYSKGLSWPLSKALSDVFIELPWFYALCILSAFPALILYERYRGRKPNRFIQGIIVWELASVGYTNIVLTFYESFDYADLEVAVSSVGGVMAGVIYWLIMRSTIAKR